MGFSGYEPFLLCRMAWVQNIVIKVSVCLPVYPKMQMSKLTKFSVHGFCGCMSVLPWQRYDMLCNSSFVDATVFAHNCPDRDDMIRACAQSDSTGDNKDLIQAQIQHLSPLHSTVMDEFIHHHEG